MACCLTDGSAARGGIEPRPTGLPALLAGALTVLAALTAAAADPGTAAAPPTPAPANGPATPGASAPGASSRLAPPPEAPPCSEPLCYTATRLTAERNHIVLTDIDIVDTTRGLTQIKADRAEATGLDLGNSRWELTGHVQVYMPQGQLQADSAAVQFTDKRIVSITADGSPAEFNREVPRDGRSTNVTGHAQQITYDLARDQVQLSGNSWLTDGCNDVSTQQITYDIASQRVEASAAPGSAGQVHGTIGARTAAPCTPGPSPP